MFDFPNSPSAGDGYTAPNGLTWTWDGTAWISTPTSVGEITIRKTFIPGVAGSATVYAYNKPSNLRQLEFEGVAAGGSAGPAIATGASVWSFSSGGGGGSWGRKLFTAAALPASVTITIGAPGQGVSSGNGQDAAATTFGALITLPGGLKGLQGSNTAYSSVGYVSGSQVTNDPTGVDVGTRGESSDGAAVGISSGAGAGLSGYMGKAGQSPWGKSYPAFWGSGANSVTGYGYGAGSSGPLNSASSALKASVAGGPGAVLLTEYLATAPGQTYLTALDQNLIINPAIQISQETAFGTTFSAQGHVADQWNFIFSAILGTSVTGAAQSQATNNVPLGQITFAGTATPYTSVAATAYAGIVQVIEGGIVAPLNWGVNAGAGAAIPAVLTFECFCTVAGTYCVSLRNGAGADRSICFPITIAAGEINTWKRFTFAVPAITTGTFSRDTNIGLSLFFTGMCGTTYQAPSSGAWLNGNYFGLAGMSNLFATASQSIWFRRLGLYADPGGTGVAPEFKVPDLQSELVKCQRYWQKIFNWWCGNTGSGTGYYTYPVFPVPMRAAPTVAGVNHSAGNFPAAIGTLTPALIAGQISLVAVQEVRTASATGNASYYGSVIWGSARM